MLFIVPPSRVLKKVWSPRLAQDKLATADLRVHQHVARHESPVESETNDAQVGHIALTCSAPASAAQLMSLANDTDNKANNAVLNMGTR